MGNVNGEDVLPLVHRDGVEGMIIYGKEGILGMDALSGRIILWNCGWLHRISFLRLGHCFYRLNGLWHMDYPN